MARATVDEVRAGLELAQDAKRSEGRNQRGYERL